MADRLLDWRGREQEAPRFWSGMHRMFGAPGVLDEMFPEFAKRFPRDWRYRVQFVFGLSIAPGEHTYELESEHRDRIRGPLYVHEAYERWLDALRDGERLLLEGRVQ